MELRTTIGGKGENIPFAEIGERYLSIPDFLRILSGYPDFLQNLQSELEESQGDVIRMAKCVRELMCIDFISKTTDWGNITPDLMVKIQGGFKNFGDAYLAYQTYQDHTRKSQAEIEQVTLEIQELEKKSRIDATLEEARNGVKVIQGPWGKNPNS